MSVMTIDAATYRKLLAERYIVYCGSGYSNAVALQKAQELMEGAFRSDEAEDLEIREWDSHSSESNIWWPQK